MSYCCCSVLCVTRRTGRTQAAAVGTPAAAALALSADSIFVSLLEGGGRDAEALVAACRGARAPLKGRSVVGLSTAMAWGRTGVCVCGVRVCVCGLL